MGLMQQLSSAEILEQLWHAHVTLATKMGPKQVCNKGSQTSNSFLERKIRNVVFMGMGEPLDNYKSVLGALR
jgi:adenine C2-methylase RlmN of 23S rRNA A2503 and tRNA A37